MTLLAYAGAEPIGTKPAWKAPTNARLEAERAAKRAEAARKHMIERCVDLLRRRGVPQPVRAIILEAADRHGVPPLAVVNDVRIWRVVAARHEAMYLVKADGPMRSTTTIGGWFGKDHTSVLFGIAKHAELNDLPRLVGYDYRHAVEYKRRTSRAAAERRKAA